MSEKLRAVVVGTSFGGRVHVPALRAAGIEVHALVGRDEHEPGNGRARLGSPPRHHLAHRRLSDGAASVVTVATPPHSHRSIVIEALEAGCHVLCEKPFAADAAEARSMLAAATAAGTVALVGCEFRWVPDEALAGRVIRAGAIGEPRLATFVLHSGIVARGLHEAFNEEWWFSAERGGGMLGAGGIHFIDRFRTWFGDIDRVSAVLQVAGDRPAGPSRGHLQRHAPVCLRDPRRDAALLGGLRPTQPHLPGHRVQGKRVAGRRPGVAGRRPIQRPGRGARRPSAARPARRRATTPSTPSPSSSCRPTPGWPSASGTSYSAGRSGPGRPRPRPSATASTCKPCSTPCGRRRPRAGPGSTSVPKS